MKYRRFLIAAVICLAFLCLAAAAGAEVIINEVMASNGYYTDGNAWDWVELYNDGSGTVSLSGWGFTDSKKDLYKFTFPDGAKLKAGEYLTIWCTGEENDKPGKGDTFYADFAISAKGETLRLTDADGQEIGVLKDVYTGPANDVYIVKGEKEYMIPAVSEFLEDVNVDEGYVRVRLIEGMAVE